MHKESATGPEPRPAGDFLEYDAADDPIGGARYRNDSFAVTWHTSVPRTKGQAVDYFDTLYNMGVEAAYVETRGDDQLYVYETLPFHYDIATGEVSKIG